MPPPSHRPPPRGNGQQVQVAIDTARVLRRVFVVWLAIEVFLVVADLAIIQMNLTTLVPLHWLFNLEREDGLGDWLASLQTFLIAVTVWAIYWRVQQPPHPNGWRLGWLILALFLTYLAIDDGAAIHERIGSAGVVQPSGWVRRVLALFPTYMWHLMFGPLFAALGLFMLVFLLRELRDSRPLVLVGMMCLVGAVGFDVLDGMDMIVQHLHIVRIAEEVIEMFGFTVLWIAVLKHLFQLTDRLAIVLTRGEESERCGPIR
jgi:hypothetical protein